MRAGRALGVGIAPAIFAVALAAAAAEPAVFSLSVSAPAECPSTEALRAEVLRLARLGADSTRRLDARIVVSQAAGGHFTLELRTELEGVQGERSFDGTSCQAVSDAAALTLALMLNPEVEREQPAEPAPAPAPAPPAPAAPAVTAVPTPAEAPRPEPGPKLRGTIAAFGGFQAGILPQAGLDLGVSLGLSLGRASAWLGVSYDPEQDVRLAETNAGATLSAASARILGCYSLFDADTTLGPCAGVELDRIAGIGTGISDPDEGSIYWTSALFGVSASLEFRPSVHLYAALSGLVTLGPPKVFLEGIGEVHEPATPAGRAQLGVAVDLW